MRTTNYLFFLAFFILVLSGCNRSKTASAVPEKETVHDEIKEAVPDEIIYLKDYDLMNSFEEVIRPFAGRKLYIDLWDTYCKYCIQEFAHKEEMKEYLEENDFTLLYISIDTDDRHQRWEDMVNRYQLDGYHVRANHRLNGDILSLFSRKKGFSIPLYIIVDENGQVTDRDADRPSVILLKRNKSGAKTSK